MLEQFWDPLRVAALERMHEERRSAKEIAAVLGTTRNAVLGKVFRLGLSEPAPIKPKRDPEADRKARNLRQLQRRAAQRLIAREIKMAEIEAASLPHPEALRIPLMDLRDMRADAVNQCRYIADEPAGPLYLACGLDTEPGESYCLHCLRIVTRRPFELNETDKLKKRAHFIRIGNASKIGRTLDMGDAA